MMEDHGRRRAKYKARKRWQVVMAVFFCFIMLGTSIVPSAGAAWAQETETADTAVSESASASEESASETEAAASESAAPQTESSTGSETASESASESESIQETETQKERALSVQALPQQTPDTDKAALLSDITDSGYIAASSLTDTDMADAAQKNFTIDASSNNTSYLYKTAEWTDKDAGKARITITASRDKGASAVYAFTTCTEHGFTKALAISNIRFLLSRYQKVDIIGINASSTDGIRIIRNVTADNVDSTLSGQFTWAKNRHWSSNIYAGLYEYLYGGLTSGLEQVEFPTDIYTSFDNIADTGISSYSYNCWDLLKSYKSAGHYFSMVGNYINDTAKDASKMTSELCVFRYSSDPQQANTVAGLMNPFNFPGLGVSDYSSYAAAVSRRGRFQDFTLKNPADYSYSQSMSTQIAPLAAAVSDTVSDRFVIDSVSTNYGSLKAVTDGNTVTATDSDYQANTQMQVYIDVHLKDSSAENIGKWIDTNASDAGFLFTSGGVKTSMSTSSPKLAYTPDVKHELDGRLWYDSNANGMTDPGEQAPDSSLAVKMQITTDGGKTWKDAADQQGAALKTVIDGAGHYEFNNFAPGQYRVLAQIQPDHERVVRLKSSTLPAETADTAGTQGSYDNDADETLITDDNGASWAVVQTLDKTNIALPAEGNTYYTHNVDFGFVPRLDASKSCEILSTGVKDSGTESAPVDVLYGDTVKYTITLTNSSAVSTADGVIALKDQLPDGLTYISSEMADPDTMKMAAGDPDVDGQTLTFSALPAVSAGARYTITITAFVTEPGKDIFNTAHIIYPDGANTPSNTTYHHSYARNLTIAKMVSGSNMAVTYASASLPGTADVTLKKTVTGTGAPSNASFGFKLTVRKADGTPRTGSFSYELSSGATGTLTLDANGTGNISGITAGGSVTIHGLHNGDTYTAEEESVTVGNSTAALSDSASWTSSWKDSQKLIISLNGYTPAPVSGYAMWLRPVRSYLAAGSNAVLADIPSIRPGTNVRFLHMNGSVPNPAIDTQVPSILAGALLSDIHVNADGTLSLTAGGIYTLVNNTAYYNLLKGYYLYIDYGSNTVSGRTAAGMVYQGSGAEFVNNYTPTYKTLTISKTVKGDLSDPLKKFSFSIGLTAADGTAETAAYHYRIYAMTGSVPNPSSDTLVTADGTIASGSGSFLLSHRQYIVISNLPEGEKYTVTETGSSDYTTTITAQNGTAAEPSVRAKTVGQRTIAGGSGDVNREDYTNTRQSVPPTGIIIESLPYILIVLLVLAAGAGLAFSRIQRKKRGGRS